MSRRETAASKLDLHGHNTKRRACILYKVVLEQMWCVDWLGQRVYTKQTTGCLRWDCRVSNTLILPYTLSLFFFFSLMTIRFSAACSCCRMHSHWLVGWNELDSAAKPFTLQRLEGSTSWHTCYKVARSKQGTTVSSSLSYLQLPGWRSNLNL